MRWLGFFRRRRRPAGRHASLPGHRPGTWAEVALPPRVQVVPPPSVPEALLETPSPMAPTQPRVRLGFADGTSVEIDSASQASTALRETASRLLASEDS